MAENENNVSLEDIFNNINEEFLDLELDIELDQAVEEVYMIFICSIYCISADIIQKYI